MIEDPPKHWDEFIPSEEDKRVRINACATMWHENSEEIQVCLKSVFQMDKYINNRRRDDHERSEWQKWDWQTHIFFDDCMKKSRTEKVNKITIKKLSRHPFGITCDFSMLFLLKY